MQLQDALYHDEFPVLASKIFICRLGYAKVNRRSRRTAVAVCSSRSFLREVECFSGMACRCLLWFYIPTTSSNAFCCARNMVEPLMESRNKAMQTRGRGVGRRWTMVEYAAGGSCGSSDR